MARWSSSFAGLAVGLLVGLSVGLLVGACDIRHLPSPIQLDGELDEPIWKTAIRTGPFVNDAGQAAAPYSDARFLVARDFLYVALYAADEDIKKDDVFELEVGGRAYHYGPADPGPEVGVDMDGTLEDPSDLDEEWVVETRIARAELPRGDVPVRPRTASAAAARRASFSSCPEGATRRRAR
jgi:hypothetical protein